MRVLSHCTPYHFKHTEPLGNGVGYATFGKLSGDASAAPDASSAGTEVAATAAAPGTYAPSYMEEHRAERETQHKMFRL